jgi:signal transduction histidine kinase
MARPRSLRVRLTVLVTVAVALALTLASFALVTSMSRSLVGDVEDDALALVDEVAEALAAGKPIPDTEVAPEHLTVVQVQDTSGRVLRQIPDVSVNIDDLPEEIRVARAGAAGDEPRGATPSDEQVLAWRTVSTPDGDRMVLAISRLGSITRSVNLVIGSLLVATPLLTLFVGFLTWVAVGRALRPVEAIRRHAEVISHSTLDERLPPPRTGDEVAWLTATLNEMLDRIATGARRQREFVSDASHELRTPLAAIRADLEVSLAARDAWPAVGRRLLADHERLERLTADLLLLARLDDGTGAGPREPVRLDAIVAGELDTVRRAHVMTELTPATVLGAEPELARLVRNLLENADRHAAAEIVVRLRLDGPTVVLTVDDDGPGVPAGQRDRVFDRFFRLDASRARTSGGAGLAMVRRVADGHGGAVTVSEAPLGGARFEVRLPAVQ